MHKKEAAVILQRLPFMRGAGSYIFPALSNRKRELPCMRETNRGIGIARLKKKALAFLT
jgi:hypothetical protein